MRAYMIVVFILAIHAGLAMINVAHITDIYGFNTSIDTSSKGTFVVINGSNISVPSSTYFCETATGQDISSATDLAPTNFVGEMIQTITGMTEVFVNFMNSFKSLIFSIHTFGAPYFGDFNAWVLEGMVDFIFSVALFQIVTGRSFKTME